MKKIEEIKRIEKGQEKLRILKRYKKEYIA